KIGEDSEITFRAGAQVDMAAFAGHRYPGVPYMHEARHTEPRARPEYDTTCGGFGLARPDALQVLLTESHDGQRLRLEVIEHDNVRKPHFTHHAAWPHDPGRVGHFDFVTVDGPGHRKHRRARYDGGAVEDRGLDGLVYGLVVGRLHGRKLLRFCIGIDQDRKARIGAANIPDQD